MGNQNAIGKKETKNWENCHDKKVYIKYRLTIDISGSYESPSLTI